jgi:MFS transporter, putative metabolite:H+ symporter
MEPDNHSPGMLIARLDRIPIWSLATRARTTGFALVDGVGHLGGGIGVLLIAPLIPELGVLRAMLLICGFLVLAAVIAQFGTVTRSRMLEEVSP